MNKALRLLADEMRVLKLKDKAKFLSEIKKYAVLYDPENPQSIPECSLEDAISFSLQLKKNLFYSLKGHYYCFPKYRSLLSEEELKKQTKEDICKGRINRGLYAYLYAKPKERKQFERCVKMPNLFAFFLRQRKDHDFK